MLCPNCKVHSVRKTDTDDGDVLQCHLCSRTFELDETNHLRPLRAQAVEVKPAQDHEVETKAPISETKAPKKETPPAVIETPLKKSLEREAPLKLKTGAIAESYHAEVLRRLAAGDKPGDIAKDIGYAPSAVYSFKYKHTKGIRAAQKVKKSAPPAADPPGPAAGAKTEKNDNKPELNSSNYANKKGNILSQMGRLRRGIIKPQQARGVMSSYKKVLEYELKLRQGEIKAIKCKLAATDEALRQLDIVQQGEKAAVDNLFTAVGNGRKG